MRKLKKSLLIVLGGLCLFLYVPHNAQAKTNIENNEQVIIEIKTNSEEEYMQVVKEIEEQNKKAEDLWKKAIRQSLKEGSMELPIVTQERTTATTTARTGTLSISYAWTSIQGESIGAYVSYYREPLGSSYKFGTINNIAIYAANSANTISNTFTDYVKIDQGRTLGVNATFLVKIANSSGSQNTFAKKAYIEFYTNGKGYWY